MYQVEKEQRKEAKENLAEKERIFEGLLFELEKMKIEVDGFKEAASVRSVKSKGDKKSPKLMNKKIKELENENKNLQKFMRLKDLEIAKRRSEKMVLEVKCDYLTETLEKSGIKLRKDF